MGDTRNTENDPESAALAITEPQHKTDRLRVVYEHGSEWVSCLDCGRQWAIDGSHAELVSVGDESCDEQAVDE